LDPSQIPARRRQVVLESLAVCLALWALAVLLQSQAGAYHVEFASHPDESAHYITGLMIRDYVMSGHFHSPLAYAENYYAHYPKVALGMWPPLFHLIEALWTLMFSPSKTSVLLLMALVAALTATSIYYLVRRRHPWVVALVAATLYVLSPLVQVSTAAVMVDGLVALLDLWAAIYLVRYFVKESTRDAVFFGVLAALSMATKANGVALVLLPVILIPLTGRWHLLRARGLYYAAAIVLIFGAPWTVLSYRLISRSMGGQPVTVSLIASTASAYLHILWGALGWGLTPFCAIGIIVCLVCSRRGPADLSSAGMFALLSSIWIYHSLIANGDARYMMAALPPALVLAAAGFVWAARRILVPAIPFPARALALGALAAILFATRTWELPRKPYHGFDQAAHFLLTTPAFAAGNFLVISHARGEGAFISEIAMHDRRPGHMVLRSTKVLSSSTWYGTVYHLRYQSPPEIRDFLDNAPIDAVVLDTRPPEAWPDESAFRLEQKVSQALKGDPHWTLCERYPKLLNQSPWIDLYSRVGPQPAGSIHLDLRYTLGKDIVEGDQNRAK
jgi:4-amino-4-deoxy-L-arabinose transferase-like glycosyltransferase